MEEVRQAIQDFPAPELRSLSAKIEALETRIASLDEVSRVRHEAVMDQFRTMKENLGLDKRLTRLEITRNPEQPAA